MITTILSNSLMGGHVLPAQLPRLRDRLLYHESHTNSRFLNPFFFKAAKAHPNVKDINQDTTEPMVQIDGTELNMGLDLHKLTLDVLFVSTQY